MSAGIVISKIILWGLGGVILVFCGAMCGFWPVILNFQLRKELVLSNDSRSYNLWKDTPIPMYLEIYMFNWTNPLETLRGNAKPTFLELGPYVFTETNKKMDIIWNDNDTITFKQRRGWHFVPEMSKGSLDDKVTNINVIAMTIGNLIVKHVSPSWYPIVNEIIKFEENEVFVTKPVQELLFDGYSDKFLNISKILEKIIKIKIPFDKFGWFYSRNNSVDYDGVFNMKTGASGLDTLGEIVQWNYSPKSPSYPGHCGAVDGTSGELWPLNAATSQFAKIFVTDLCSSLQLTRNGESSVYGIQGSTFVADKTVFDNGDLVADNRCYCANNTCPATGSRDISICRFGAPAFISLPHFYLADTTYLNNISGMSPSPKLHSLYLTLEKVTSIPLEVHARLQISIRSQPIRGLKFYEKLPYAYMPMLWFDQSAAVTPALSAELSSIVAVANIIEPLFIGLTVVGGLMVILGLLLWRFHCFSSESDTPLLTSSTSS